MRWILPRRQPLRPQLPPARVVAGEQDEEAAVGVVADWIRTIPPRPMWTVSPRAVAEVAETAGLRNRPIPLLC
jgi:hypothetical protein